MNLIHTYFFSVCNVTAANALIIDGFSCQLPAGNYSLDTVEINNATVTFTSPSNITANTMSVTSSGIITASIVYLYAGALTINGSLTAAVLTINATTVYFGTKSTISVSASPLASNIGVGSYHEDAGLGVCYHGGGGHGGSGKLINTCLNTLTISRWS